MNEFKNAIENYAKYVVQQSRSRLSKEGKNKGSLYKSLSYIILQNRGASGRFESGYTVTFDMEDYGKFVDKGVKGSLSSSKGNQQAQSPYQFGNRTALIGKQNGGMSGIMRKWVEKRKFRWRDKATGKFMSYKSMSYLIARSIYTRGIKPTLFFTKPFESGVKRFGDKIVVAYGNEILKKLVKK